MKTIQTSGRFVCWAQLIHRTVPLNTSFGLTAASPLPSIFQCQCVQLLVQLLQIFQIFTCEQVLIHGDLFFVFASSVLPSSLCSWETVDLSAAPCSVDLVFCGWIKVLKCYFFLYLGFHVTDECRRKKAIKKNAQFKREPLIVFINLFRFRILQDGSYFKATPRLWIRIIKRTFTDFFFSE